MFFYLLVISITIIYFFLKYKHSYWTRKGIPQVDPEFFFGNLRECFMGKLNFNQTIAKLYDNLRQRGEKYGGIYLFYTPIWLITDTKLAKRIMTTDLEYFNAHGFFTHDNDPMSRHLFSLDGEKWKELRSKLTPTFTSGKLKSMFPTLDILGDVMEKRIADSCNRHQPIEMKELASGFGIDVVATCFFGLESDSLANVDSEFREAGKRIFDPRYFEFFLENTFSWDLLGKLGHTFFSKKVYKFFSNLTKETVAYREKNNVSRNDYLQILMQLRSQTKPGEKELLTFQEMVANMVLMYGAGYETTSTTTIFLMYELAKNPEIQDKLREEILATIKKSPTGRITYDELNEMKYADACITETIRRYSPIPEVPRQCLKTYQIPGTNVLIEKGTRLFIPGWGIHNDAEHFPDPHKFNPDNFFNNKKGLSDDVTFFGFGGGPRLCIGSRFALMQVKSALIKYLTNFKYTLNPKTPQTLSYISFAITLTCKEDIFLDVTPINVN